MHSCPGCIETARLKAALGEQARREAGTSADAQSAVDKALAGHFIALVPFDPHRGLVRAREDQEEE